ncbi:uncharacterized protein LOC129905389 [Episyrphus balteatus]|uniref:uncharacterized protein LOC129905389 n=1 Tax=Episyrphus balteatus TaxID=286459 RepID=UPI0024851DEC|nr:uncharacterized protein LOC129905389 [Episyrphus balteatus]
MYPRKKKKQDELEISYSKIHVPKMKSVFWKYFGFPADDNNEIITKTKVVCTLCKSLLKNHYNTTNIRAHIQSNHKAIFSQLISTHGINIPPRKPNQNLKRSIKGSPKSRGESSSPPQHHRSKQVKVDYSDSSLIEEETFNIPLTYEDTEDEPTITTTDVSNIFDEAIVIEDQTDLHLPVKSSREEQKVLAPLNITVDINPIQVNYNIEEALTKMIVTDLRNVSSIYDCGMKEFVTSFLSNQILPTLSKMENTIENFYNKKFEKLRDRIKIHSQVKSYSLSFDVWTNIEGKQFVSIHYNHISEEFEDQFCDNLYVTIELNSYSSFETIFAGFNLQNCSAAIINSNNEIINTFLSSSDIPIVYCFGYIINTCISNIFAIAEINSIFNEVIDVMTRFASEIASVDTEVPSVCEEFAISKLHVLRFFCESVSWPEDMDLLLAKAKQIVDILSPLEITIDTLREEEIPLSSLFLPFAEKIIEKHYVHNEFDDSLVNEMKETVIDQFKRSVCLNNLLTVTAVLDPRFHKFISLKSMTSCLKTLETKYQQIGKQQNSPQKTEHPKVEPQKSSRKSHLKMFFVDNLEETPSKTVQNENFIEIDLRRYRDEAFASLEESPIKWWSQWGSSYKSLRHLSDAYCCILGFVNLSLKDPLKDQINNYRRRFILTGKLINQIIFLNKNQ